MEPGRVEREITEENDDQRTSANQKKYDGQDNRARVKVFNFELRASSVGLANTLPAADGHAAESKAAGVVAVAVDCEASRRRAGAARRLPVRKALATPADRPYWHKKTSKRFKTGPFIGRVLSKAPK